MNLTTLEKCLPYLLEAKITPCIWGYHARGKTKYLENFGKSRDWLVFNFRLGTQADVGDLLGQSEIAIDDEGNSFTRFNKPDWMHEAFEFCKNNPDKKALIILDEFNLVTRQDMIPPIFQMALDYRLHTYKFPDNMVIIACGNPETKDYRVTKFASKAYYSRFCHIKLEPTTQEWFNWANVNEFPSEITGFLKQQPEFIENNDLEDFDISKYVERDRRKWEGIKRLWMDVKAPKDVIMSVAPGLVETKTVIAWKEYLKKGETPVTVEEILNDYPKVANDIKQQSSFGEKGRHDMIKHTCDNLIAYVIKNDIPKTKKKKENLAKFILDIPGEVAFDFCLKVKENIEDDSKFTKFLNENDAILNYLQESKGKKAVND